MNTKAELRKHFQQLRRSLSETQCSDYDASLLAHFARLELNGLTHLHLFLPIPHKKEVNSWLFANWIRMHHPEIRLVLSRADFDTHALLHILWEESTPLAENTWGITEPQSGKEIRAEELDMVLVPLLAFDLNGNRVGYGKGFYDRFLAQCRPGVQKIGLSHFEPVELIADADELDIRLDACISPEKIWRFS